MGEEDPIRQLQHLLEDPGNLLERISRIQSVIGSTRPSEPLPIENAAPVGRDQKETDSPPYDGLLRMLCDMQMQIDQRVRPLALAAIHAEGERLRQLAKQEQATHDQSLAQVDQSLIACFDRIEQSQKIHADLVALNRRLEQLGAPTERVQDFPAALSPGEIIQTRIEELRRQGKL